MRYTGYMDDYRRKVFVDQKIQKAQQLIRGYKKGNYRFGTHCLDQTGKFAAQLGRDVLLVISSSEWAKPLRKTIQASLKENRLHCKKVLDTPLPDTPISAVKKMAEAIEKIQPQCMVCVGGGSAIDCAKAANIAATLHTGDLEPFFGAEKVRPALEKDAKSLVPMVAVQTNAGSGSHLSKNAVVTDMDQMQKKLISDPCLVPDRAVFDYTVTQSLNQQLTIDGALDGFSHCLEIYYSLKDDAHAQQVCLTGISIIVDYLPLLAKDLTNEAYRKAIGLATDLGGYALMLGNTSGAHLNSFSMVGMATHGRACAILNPYYTVFYAPALGDKLHKLAHIFSRYMDHTKSKDPRKIAEALARAMLSFYQSLGFPTTLGQLEGFSPDTIEKALEAAKNPQLEMKLKSMPQPLDIQSVDCCMRPVLEAARTGKLEII